MLCMNVSMTKILMVYTHIVSTTQVVRMHGYLVMIHIS